MSGLDPSAAVGAAQVGPAAAITTEGLTKRYDTLIALDHLDLSVPAGSVFGLLGPNGAGKTTTIRLLTGLAHPTSGTARVVGVRIGTNEAALHAHIGYLDQDPRYYGWMRGRELLELAGRLHGLEGRALRTRVDEVLDIVGLPGIGDRRMATYSGGMEQRIGIGQALMNRPALLILDEPMSSLDPQGRRDMIELIRSLRGQATVLLSTHILSDVERVCDRVAILDQGRLVIESSVEELLNEHARPVYRLDAEPNQESALTELLPLLRAASWAGTVSRTGDEIRVNVGDPVVAAREILPLLVQVGVRLAVFERLRPSLEDVFLQLVRPNGGAAVELAATAESAEPAASARSSIPEASDR